MSMLMLLLFVTTATNPTFTPDEISYEDAVEKWFKWIIQFPLGKNPIYDDNDGKLIQQANQQSQEVFFLSGKFYSVANRTIVVDSSQSIFFPVIEGHYVYKGTGIYSFNQNALAKLNELDDVDTVYHQASELDGKPLDTYRIKAFFNSDYKPNNLFGLEEGKNLPTLVDGYWVFLKPLPLGFHTIHLKGADHMGYHTEVTYNVTSVKSNNN